MRSIEHLKHIVNGHVQNGKYTAVRDRLTQEAGQHAADFRLLAPSARSRASPCAWSWPSSLLGKMLSRKGREAGSNRHRLSPPILPHAALPACKENIMHELRIPSLVTGCPGPYFPNEKSGSQSLMILYPRSHLCSGSPSAAMPWGLLVSPGKKVTLVENAKQVAGSI